MITLFPVCHVYLFIMDDNHMNQPVCEISLVFVFSTAEIRSQFSTLHCVCVCVCVYVCVCAHCGVYNA